MCYDAFFRFSSYAFRFTGKVDPYPVLMKGLRLQGIYVGSREMFEAMNKAMAVQKIKPVIDKIFPFAEERAAVVVLIRL